MLELADTTAWSIRRRDPAVRKAFDIRVERGEVATCDMVKLELLHTARNPREFATMRRWLDALPTWAIGPSEWQRAIDVYEELCRSGPGNDAHRRVGHADLLIAAAAEAAGLTLVHYDQDYDTIAQVTGQPARWLAPRGSL